MFKNLTNLGYKRSGKEAFGFYLAYLLLVIIVSALIGAIMGIATNPSDGFSQGVQVGTIVVSIICIVLSIWILSAKKAMKFGLILVSLLAGLLALFGGGLLGLIIPACFTRLESKEISFVPVQ